MMSNKFIQFFVTYYRKKTSRIHPSPIIILGSPKSGTTVIASLLANSIGESLIIDPFYKIPNNIIIRNNLHSGQLSFENFLNTHKYFFSHKIIKDPYLIFFIEEIQDFFENAKFIYISRDPRENIRSILNRLKIPGNLKDIDISNYKNSIPKGTAWELLLEGKLPNVSGETYIERLAYRWNLAIELYASKSDKVILFRYEDFLTNKVHSIEDLAKQLDRNPLHSISSAVDIQYQPVGNRKISWLDFFGKQNLCAIESICKRNMNLLNY